MGITEEKISKEMQNYDLIVTDVDKEGFFRYKDISIFDQFNKCHKLTKPLFDNAKKILQSEPFKEKYGDIGGELYEQHFYHCKYKPYFKSVLIAKKEYFLEYIDFIISVLGELEKVLATDIGGLTYDDSYRLLAFFAERLTSLFINYKKNKGLRVKAVKRFHQSSLQGFLDCVYPSKSIDAQTQALIPLIRFYNRKLMDPAYVPTEVYDKKGPDLEKFFATLLNQGYACEGLVGYLYKNDENKKYTPVYMCRDNIKDDYFLTASKEEYDHVKTTHHFEDYGIIGYISPVAEENARKFHRYYFELEPTHKHFYTTNTIEYAVLRCLANWKRAVEEEAPGFIRMV